MHDVIIIGAGPGGSATAYYLARHGLDVLFIDKSDFPRDKTCGDGLTPRALAVLEDMGLLNDLLQIGCRVNSLEIAAPKGHAVAAPFPGKNGQPGYALTVPRLILDDAIRKLAIVNGAVFEHPLRVTDLITDHNSVLAIGKRQGKTIKVRGRLAVIATGATIPLLMRIGILKKSPRMALAARAYFEGVKGLTNRMQLRFDGVPLPGYGWIFPLPNESANIGAGVFPAGWAGGRLFGTGLQAYEAFIHAPALQHILARTRQVGPVKGYPLRTDFATAPTYGERLLLVGEAAGLVNPLTGEGIDYALESGRLAAEHLIGLLSSGDLSLEKLSAYDQLLRQRFQRLFIACNWIRDLCVNPLLINQMVSAAGRRPDLKLALINLAFGHAAQEEVTIGRILRRLFNWN